MRTAGLALALLLAACAQASAPLPARPVAAGSAITVRAAPVGERADGLELLRLCADIDCGEWTYAGGLHLTSQDTSRLHGLSDLEVTAEGALTAVTDDGDLLQARLILGPTGDLTGLTAARLTPLRDPAGQPLGGDKARADAEGLASLAAGRLVSFEHDHRIWLYPVGGGPPRSAPSPTAVFPDNEGLEALAADPERGTDAYVAGAEASGETWLCRLATGCAAGPKVAKPAGMGLVAAVRVGPDRMAWLLRGYDPLRGARVELRVTDGALRRVDDLRIERPATVDNFEGLAAVPRRDGRVRFYILSDDNFSASQRTLLLAFDWQPPD